MLNCLVLGLALSLHAGLENKYNQKHPYLMCETEDVIGGVYYNSLDKWSVVGGVKYDLTNDITLDVGVVTGYHYDVVPMARLRYKNLFIMPALEDDRTGVVVGFQFEFKLKE
jgi:hypothetical protein|tara:strand:- start:1035 stop:1370 length:336 start_codon:yes stop_codon:yes gene_type:complete